LIGLFLIGKYFLRRSLSIVYITKELGGALIFWYFNENLGKEDY